VSEELIGPVVLSDLFKGVLRLQLPFTLTGGDALLCPTLFTSSYRNFSLSSYRSDACAVSVTRRLYSDSGRDSTSFLVLLPGPIWNMNRFLSPAFLCDG
jgi:hypothetical protein